MQTAKIGDDYLLDADLVICIDRTLLTDGREEAIRSVFDGLEEKLSDLNVPNMRILHQLRVRMIFFSQTGAPISTTNFFALPEEQAALLDQYDRMAIYDHYSDSRAALTALKTAMLSPWAASAVISRQLILMISWAQEPDGQNSDMMKSLSAMWGRAPKNGTAMKYRRKSLAIIAPAGGPWKEIAETWDRGALHPIQLAEVADGDILKAIGELV